MKLSVNEILRFLQKNDIYYEYFGDSNLTIERFCSLNFLKTNSIFWVRNIEDYKKEKLETYDSMLMVTSAKEKLSNINYINCKDPKRVFFSILSNFWKQERKNCIQSTSVVETRQIGENVYIGHHCFINKDVIIGNNVTIMHNVTIVCPTVIKDNTIIHSGVIIGTDGFGYYQDEDGMNQKVMHYGGVQIGADVEVGANTCIDRGTIDDTVIGDNVKIDDLCLIAHNSQIGKNAMIVGKTAIGGSTVVGDNAYVAPSSAIMNQVKVEKGAYVGMGSIVLKDVKEGQKVFGNPARLIK